eukprot:scaffold41604_cov63-Phaeocystis_antarctica.AAC.2
MGRAAYESADGKASSGRCCTAWSGVPGQATRTAAVASSSSLPVASSAAKRSEARRVAAGSDARTPVCSASALAGARSTKR